MKKYGIQNVFRNSADASDLLGKFFRTRDADRLDFIHQWSRGNGFRPAIASSFGDQSILLLGKARRQSGFEFPIVTVDIPGKNYDQQRQYRDHLQKELGLNLLVFQADSFEDKVQAMDRGLADNDFQVVIHGVRAAQTENREKKSIVEFNTRNKTIEFFPLFDWPDAKTIHYIREYPEALRHPDYGTGKLFQGGAAVGEKTECGLHTVDLNSNTIDVLSVK